MASRDTSRKQSADEQLADDISQFYADPLGYVMYVFPWDTNERIQIVRLAPEYQKRFNCEFGPDIWACQFLDKLGKEIRKRGFDGRNAVEPVQFSTASGHGIGKSALAAWLVKFIMDTRPFSKGTVTANTDTQLRTKTWAALGAWHKLSLTEHWFLWATGRGAMAFKHRDYPEDWQCTAQTCREENSESFAGQHAANATSFYLFDEASGVPDKIFEVRKGGLMTGEPMVFDFGNPTRNSGAFFENTVGKQAHRYITTQIDARDVAITNKKEQQKMIDDYGIDSDIVKVRILGQFPAAGSLQFIPNDFVDMAIARQIMQERNQPLVIGVDVARFGDDDTIIFPRMGNDARSFGFKRFNGLDTWAVTTKVAEMVREFRSIGKEVSAIFVDGGGVGGGVVDNLRRLGFPVFDVNFGGSPSDKATYRYRGDEMWGRMKDALGKRLAIADDVDLRTQLTQREFGYTVKLQINLESKSDMKERLGSGSSPDIADALALTYAAEVNEVAQIGHNGGPAMTAEGEYDPLEEGMKEFRKETEDVHVKPQRPRPAPFAAGSRTYPEGD